MDFTPGQQKLLAYWGEIQSAVSSRSSTADLWAAVRGAAQIDGVDLSGVNAIDMGTLRSLAAQQRNSMETLQRAGPSDVITASMIGSDLSSRSLQDQNLSPMFLVRFEHDVVVNGQLTTLWRSSYIDRQLPTTKSDLLDTVNQDAQAMAADYGTTHAGVGRIQISAV